MDKIIEYAILAQKCYIPAELWSNPDKKLDLPKNWTSLWHYQGGYGNCYALYVNEVRKEIILGIKGSDNTFNYLSDALLLAGAFRGNRQKPLGQRDVEGIAYNILEQDQHFSPNRVEAIRGMSRSIQGLDNDLSSQLSNTVITDSYLSAHSLNIFNSTQVSSLALISSLSAGVLEPNIQSLQTAGAKVKNDMNIHLNRSDLECFSKLKVDKMTVLNSFEGYSLKIVGHSLGAVMAELCAVELKVECIGFESPGSKEIIENIQRYRLRNNYVINTYLSAPNIINTLYGHPGNSYRMFIPHTEGGFSALHALHCVAQSTSRLFTRAVWGSVVGFVTGFPYIPTVIPLSAVGLWADKRWLSRQHSIDNIVLYLQNTQRRKIRKIIKWPRLGDLVVNRAFDELGPPRGFFRRDIPGIRNILDEEGMREAYIEGMSDYEVDESDSF